MSESGTMGRGRDDVSRVACRVELRMGREAHTIEIDKRDLTPSDVAFDDIAAAVVAGARKIVTLDVKDFRQCAPADVRVIEVPKLEVNPPFDFMRST